MLLLEKCLYPLEKNSTSIKPKTNVSENYCNWSALNYTSFAPHRQTTVITPPHLTHLKHSRLLMWGFRICTMFQGNVLWSLRLFYNFKKKLKEIIFTVGELPEGTRRSISSWLEEIFSWKTLKEQKICQFLKD